MNPPRLRHEQGGNPAVPARHGFSHPGNTYSKALRKLVKRMMHPVVNIRPTFQAAQNMATRGMNIVRGGMLQAQWTPAQTPNYALLRFGNNGYPAGVGVKVPWRENV